MLYRRRKQYDELSYRRRASYRNEHFRSLPRGLQSARAYYRGKSFGDKFELCRKPLDAAKNADVVLTDVWASMGQEEEKKIREKAFEGYQVNDELMAVTNDKCMVLHCLPAHRGEEITAEVFEAHANEIFVRPVKRRKNGSTITTSSTTKEILSSKTRASTSLKTGIRKARFRLKSSLTQAV